MAVPTHTTSHALVLSFPVQGHVNPLLLLSTHLALRGCTITFVHFQVSSQPTLVQSRIESAILSPIQDKKLPLNFVTIPHGLSADLDLNNIDQVDFEHMVSVLEGLAKQQEMVEALIQSSKSTTSPISCIISDCFLYWTSNMGKKLGIPRVYFWSAGATSLYMTLLLATEKGRFAGGIQNAPQATRHPELVSQRSDSNPSPALLQFARHITGDIQGNACVLVNSFIELEGSILDGMVHDVPVKFVGPLLPLIPLADQGLTETGVEGGLSSEEFECLQWLDKQANSTVVYISFGSLASPPAALLKHLALGIEASTKSFLWVIRSYNGENTQLLPEGFEERTRHRGRIMSWAPQLRVLSHPAVGVFLTHCGWNSTLESIATGVPMLCCPIFGDQQMNSALIVKQWKVGFEMERKEGEIVAKEEVERVVRMAMEDGEASREVRGRVAAMKNAARAAVMGGGSWCSAMASFIHHTLNIS